MKYTVEVTYLTKEVYELEASSQEEARQIVGECSEVVDSLIDPNREGLMVYDDETDVEFKCSTISNIEIK